MRSSGALSPCLWEMLKLLPETAGASASKDMHDSFLPDQSARGWAAWEVGQGYLGYLAPVFHHAVTDSRHSCDKEPYFILLGCF